MESVFFKNMPEATVNRTNRKNKKKQKENKKKQKKQKKEKKQKKPKTLRKLWLRHFPQGFGFFGFFVFFVFFVFFGVFGFFGFFGCFLFFFFLLNCAKSFLVELWADKRMQKVDLGGGASIYIYTNTTNTMSPGASFSHSQAGSKETTLLLPCKAPFRSILFHAASACQWG